MSKQITVKILGERVKVRRSDGDFIQRAETFYRDPPSEERGPPVPVAFMPAKWFGHPGRKFREPLKGARKNSPKAIVYASVNHSRWIVECPTAGCGGAQVASETDPRFLCHLCQNAAAGGKWLHVVWPGIEERAEIERVLLARELDNRNWRPGETIDFLKAENIAHYRDPDPEVD